MDDRGVSRPDVGDDPDEGSLTEDGRYRVFHGRRWRSTDPALGEDVVRALTRHLGRARSAVGRAKRADDDAALRAARAQVQLAKEGLGERGAAWWERPEEERLQQARDRLAQLDGLMDEAH
ncbi:biopolymer transporter Tol [Brachybacterium sp. YJGR34]|uniref:biopolymer transporter Tol n=1 Tax=Brachybacterium sp. YJGR34 TaxID=2059911 RepID=UPI000E0C8611|nr:biopolymer transporter Tol [Brachybacterium sp. YJGR34]